MTDNKKGRCIYRRNYPEWFIEDLVKEDDKQRAREGSLLTTEKVTFKCSKGHIYTQLVSNHIVLSTQSLKQGCPICGNIIKKEKMDLYYKSLREYPQWFIEELAYEEDKQKALNRTLCKKDKVFFRCVKGHLYKQAVEKHITKSLSPRQGCPICYKEKEKTGYNAYNFHNLVGKKYGRLFVKSLVSTDNGIYWKCLCDCGNFCVVDSGNLVTGHTKSCGCIKHDFYKEKRIYPEWLGDVLVNEKDREDFRNNSLSSLNSDGSVRKVECICRKCGSSYFRAVSKFINSYSNKSNGYCTKCSRPDLYSSLEDEVKSFVNTLGNFNICYNTRFIVNPETKHCIEIDMFFQDLNLGIEVNGSYWHASKGSHKVNDKNSHFLKYRLCKEKNIHLISLFDVDWWYNKDKVKNILRSFLLDLGKVYARNTYVIRIEKSVGRSFLNKYHFDKDSNQSQIYYGLFSKDNKLLSVMSFGKLRGQNPNHKIANSYELVRFVTIPDIIIIGGASKLLNQFERDFIPKYILSYSDNDYFTGDVYRKLGFQFIKYTTPDYYWFHPSTKEYLPRWKCQPKKLKKKYPDISSKYTKTIEDNVMLELKYLKVYRCGQSVWVKDYRSESNV